MRNLKLAGVCAAALAAVLIGCGDTGGGTDAGSKFCSADSQCKMGEICHPRSKTCAKTCTAGSDCPDSAKNCDVPAGGADAGTTKVCNCATTALCGAGNVCGDYDKVCTSKCTSASDCPSGRTCDTATGACNPPGTTDAGTDGGTDAGSPCTQGSCTGGKVCAFSTGTCETPKVCVAANVQPDVCGYGQFCSTASCAEIPVATCSNFPAGSNPLQWNPATATGPVIWQKTEPADDAAFCKTTHFAFTVTLSAYRTDADWPLQLAAVPGFKYVTSSGAESDATTSMRPSGYVPSGKAATFKLTLCSTTSTAFNAGFYFTGGNAACASLTAGTQGTTP